MKRELLAEPIYREGPQELHGQMLKPDSEIRAGPFFGGPQQQGRGRQRGLEIWADPVVRAELE